MHHINSTNLGSSRTILAERVPIAMFDCSFHRGLESYSLLELLSLMREGRTNIKGESSSHEISHIIYATFSSHESPLK